MLMVETAMTMATTTATVTVMMPLPTPMAMTSMTTLAAIQGRQLDEGDWTIMMG
jgi:hypothetical protein